MQINEKKYLEDISKYAAMVPQLRSEIDRLREENKELYSQITQLRKENEDFRVKMEGLGNQVSTL